MRILVLASLIGAGLLVAPQPASCVWCSPSPCWNRCAGDACVCITPAGESVGSCYAIGSAQASPGESP